jgi:hypothetical protein
MEGCGPRGGSDRVLVLVFIETRLVPIEGWSATAMGCVRLSRSAAFSLQWQSRTMHSSFSKPGSINVSRRCRDPPIRGPDCLPFGHSMPRSDSDLAKVPIYPGAKRTPKLRSSTCGCAAALSAPAPALQPPGASQANGRKPLPIRLEGPRVCRLSAGGNGFEPLVPLPKVLICGGGSNKINLRA